MGVRRSRSSDEHGSERGAVSPAEQATMESGRQIKHVRTAMRWRWRRARTPRSQSVPARASTASGAAGADSNGSSSRRGLASSCRSRRRGWPGGRGCCHRGWAGADVGRSLQTFEIIRGGPRGGRQPRRRRANSLSRALEALELAAANGGPSRDHGEGSAGDADGVAMRRRYASQMVRASEATASSRRLSSNRWSSRSGDGVREGGAALGAQTSATTPRSDPRDPCPLAWSAHHRRLKQRSA